MALIHYHVHPSIESREAAILHEVDPSDVPADVKAAADRVRSSVSAHLGLDPAPLIRWLPPESRGVFGLTFPDARHEIWLVMRDAAGVAESTSHELKHVALVRESSSLSGSEREEAATAYGKLIRSRFGAGRPLVDPPSSPPPPSPTTVSRTAGARTSAPISPAERSRREAIWREKYAPLHDAERHRFAATHAALPLPRRKRVDRFGSAWFPCDTAGCGEMVRVGVRHRCLAARQQSRQWP